jgi:hypothetical protein
MLEESIYRFNQLAAKFGESAVLKYIEESTDGVAPEVALRWLTRQPGPSSGIQRAIWACLKNARDEDFPAGPSPIRLPLKQASPKKQRARQPEKKKTARQKIILRNAEEPQRIQENLRDREVLEKQSPGVG